MEYEVTYKKISDKNSTEIIFFVSAENRESGLCQNFIFGVSEQFGAFVAFWDYDQICCYCEGFSKEHLSSNIQSLSKTYDCTDQDAAALLKIIAKVIQDNDRHGDKSGGESVIRKVTVL